MQNQLIEKIRKCSGESEFANRLIEIATRIEQEFEGAEQERLLELVGETLDRHLDIRSNTQRAQAALKQLEADQQTLLRFFDMIASRPESETLH